MTAKLPVERTISEAYNFLFKRFFSVLGVVWLPYLVFAVVTVALVWLVAPEVPRMFVTHDVDIPGLMALGRVAGLIAILGFIVGAMVTVGLQRKALGRDPRPAYYFFSLGVPVWRMAAAFLLTGIVLFVIALLVAVVLFAIWYAADGLGGAALLVRTISIIAGLAFFIYISVRFLFFLPAVVVAEESLGIERAWTLGGHNFWRIVIIGLAVIVPAAVAFHILSWAILGPLASVPGFDWHMTAREIVRTALLQFGAVGPIVMALQLLERIVLMAVVNGAVASAYLSLTGAASSPAPAAAAPAGPAA